MMKNHHLMQICAVLLTAGFAVTISTACARTTGEAPDETTLVTEVATTSTEVAAADNTDYAYIDCEDGTIAISGYTGGAVDVVVPTVLDGKTVSMIGDHCFEANWDIKSVTIPEGIKIIGESAFQDCGSLERVEIAQSVEEVRIAAFASCTALTTITLPQNVSVVKEWAFTGCTGLQELVIENPNLEYANWGIIEGAEPLTMTIKSPVGSAMDTWAAANGLPTAAL